MILVCLTNSLLDDQLVADQTDGRVDVQVEQKICFTAGGLRQYVDTMHLW